MHEAENRSEVGFSNNYTGVNIFGKMDMPLLQKLITTPQKFKINLMYNNRIEYQNHVKNGHSFILHFRD